VRLTGLLPILALATLLAPAPSEAQYPARAIRLVVPFTAGGVTDSVARITANHMSKSLGQPVVVENRPGADGAIAAQTVKAAQPDGYTLLFATNSVLSIPLLSKSAGFDTFTDFMPVSTVGRFPFALFVHPDVPSKSVRELVDYARANPGKLNYATVNPGEQLITGQFIKATGVDMVRVPYKGGAACQTDIMGNQVDFSFQNLGAVTNYIKGNRMKALAVTAKARHPQLPDVPSVGEAGFGDLVVTSWQAAAAPAKTPKDIVARLNGAMVKALRSPDVAERMNQIGFDVVASSPEEFGAFMKAEVERWTPLLKAANLKTE